MTPFSMAPQADVIGALAAHASRLCDFCYSLVYVWEPLYHTRVLVRDGRQILAAQDPWSGEDFYEIPYRGPALLAAVNDLLSGDPCGANEPTGELFLHSIDEECLATLREAYGERMCYDTDEDESDYLYLLSDLATLGGRRFAAKRNHIRAFMREHPGYTYEPITPRHPPALTAFYENFRENHEDGNEGARAEGDAAARALASFENLPLEGGVLRENKKILGFWLGEVVGDTLFVHVEKADGEVRGAYPMLTHLAACDYAARGFIYENREEDDGDTGLRHSKRSWCPVSLLSKYRVRIRRDACASR